MSKEYYRGIIQRHIDSIEARGFTLGFGLCAGLYTHLTDTHWTVDQKRKNEPISLIAAIGEGVMVDRAKSVLSAAKSSLIHPSSYDVQCLEMGWEGSDVKYKKHIRDNMFYQLGAEFREHYLSQK